MSNEDMLTSREVLTQTSLSYIQLRRLIELGIVDKPQRRGLGNRKGVIGVFSDEVINIINWVKLQQRLGLSLMQIAEKRREELASLKTVEPQEKVLIIDNPGGIESYIKAAPSFYEQMEMENPGYEFYRVEMAPIEIDGQRYLTPVRIIMRPKR